MLTTLIIEHEYNNSLNKNIPFKFPKYVMKEITDEIRHFFHTEPEDVYFITPMNKRPMSGKLWKGYNNFKRKMNLTPYKKKPVKQIPQADQTKINLLQLMIEPNTQYFEYWNSTANYRLYNLRKSGITTKEYFNLYPALKESSGYKLIENDYRFLYEKSCDFNEEWDKVFNSIWKMGIAQNINDQVNCKDLRLASLLLLPLLITPIIQFVNGKRMKYTKPEVQNGFFLQFKDTASMELAIEERKNIENPPQPIIFIVGESLDEIIESYVAIEDVLYKFNSVFEAFSVGFKIIHGLQIKYPDQCKYIWTILRKLIFQIENNEQEYVSINTLISDLKNFQ